MELNEKIEEALAEAASQAVFALDGFQTGDAELGVIEDRLQINL